MNEPVLVDLTVDDAPPPPADERRAAPPRRRLGLVLVAVVALGVGLVAWPDGSSTPARRDESPAQATALPQVPPPTDPRMLPWPGRGPLVTETAFVDEAEQAWRAQAAVRPGAAEPGEQVAPLWAGQVGASAVALLQSVGQDGLLRLAQVSEARRPGNVQRGGLVLQAWAQLPATAPAPSMITLRYGGGLDLGQALAAPGTEVLQVLPAPDLLPEGSGLLRREGARFLPVGVQPDGLSQPWLEYQLPAGAGAVVLAARTRGLEPGIEVAQLLRPGELLPQPAPVQLVEPSWGRTRRDLPEDYSDAAAALSALGLQAGRAAVLGSTPVGDGRVALVEVDEPGGQPSGVVTVYTRGSLQYVSPLRPAGAGEVVVVGAVRTPSGQLVVVAAGPPEASSTVISADGEPLGLGPRVSAVALPVSRQVTEVAGQAYAQDQAYLGRTAIGVADLAPVAARGPAR